VTTGSRRDAWLRALLIDVPLLFCLKEAVSAHVLGAGFTHVSDDDYARVVIAQQFAHHPRLDPSGTSWLPFPFWLVGGAMRLFGATLWTAEWIAALLGILGVALPYLAMRAVGCGRATALVAIGVSLALPWSAWLGVATVPEAMTACLVSAAVIAVAEPRARVAGGVLLFAAALSRYEAWPACVVFAATCVWHARHEEGSRAPSLVAASLAVLGPLAWMAWNAHAHGDPFHFVARVTSYRKAIGAADIPLSEKLLTFPRALAASSPALVGLALASSLALPLDPTLRRRWLPALVGAAAILVFLVYGDARDGAPTHHPERAVLPILWILVPFAADATRAVARRVAWARPMREMWVFGAALAGALAWAATLPEALRAFPGDGPGEGRDVQLSQGARLAAQGERAALVVTPCAYEHFALIAAAGHPERFTILPPTHERVTGKCPRVECGNDACNLQPRRVELAPGSL
jgi:hypothetical protein